MTASRESTPLGTGGAIRQALEHLPETFFVVNGDTYLEVPLALLHDLHLREDAALTLSLVRSEEAAEKGSVRLSPEGHILEFAEKVVDGTGLVNGGVYVAQARIFAALEVGVAVSLEREIIPDLLRRGERVRGRLVQGTFVDIGLPESYLRVRDQLPRSGDRR
jgi:NDP-sugar pyrophosphorylase family protein